MLHKYKTLLRQSEQRLLVGRGFLAQHRDTLAKEKSNTERLLTELDFQKKLAHASQPDGNEFNRQQLFAWLRKSAADKRRSQELRLDLQRQEQIVDEYTQKIDIQRVVCQRLSDKRDRYETLLKQERKRIRLRQADIDEYEIEERFAWSK